MGNKLKEQLLALAVLRSKAVKIGDQEFFVREIGAIPFAEYGDMLKTSRVEATALLLSACVTDESGEPILSSEEAKAVANSSRVAMPLVNAIMEVSGFATEKEADAS